MCDTHRGTRAMMLILVRVSFYRYLVDAFSLYTFFV